MLNSLLFHVGANVISKTFDFADRDQFGSMRAALENANMMLTLEKGRYPCISK